MSGGADVGGDGSVQWHIWGDNVRPGKEINKPKGPKGHEQGHIDESADDEHFTISIEVPLDAAALGTALSNAAAAATSGASRVEFWLPIVKDHPDQIQIRWDNRPIAARRPLHALQSALTSKTGASLRVKRATKKVASRTARKSSARRKKKTL